MEVNESDCVSFASCVVAAPALFAAATRMLGPLTDRVWRAHFGVSAATVTLLWAILTGVSIALEPMHLLWALWFLKEYPTEYHAQAFLRVSTTTFHVQVFPNAVGLLLQTLQRAFCLLL